MVTTGEPCQRHSHRAGENVVVTASLHLVVPLKALRRAKSRLLGVADQGHRDQRGHSELVTAIALDTVSAASQSEIANIVVVTADETLTTIMAAEGIEVLHDTPANGLNAALRHSDEILRGRSSTARIGVLQADLPALRPSELAAAVEAADDRRAYCPDRHGSGTTLLLAQAGQPLDPRFGDGSALAHHSSEAVALDGPWESLRCDVDTEADLRTAIGLGLGPRTARCLGLRPDLAL